MTPLTVGFPLSPYRSVVARSQEIDRMQPSREGMLRPEFQDWYPSVKAGQWYPADELTALVADHFRDGSPQWRPQGRVPSDLHFEFRGEAPRRAPGRLTRSSDGSQRLAEAPPSAPPLDS